MRLRGFYAIIDVRPGNEPRMGDVARHRGIIERADVLLMARPCMLQIRAKGATAGDLAAWSCALLPLARAAGVPLCVNDRLDVALAVGADAVHLGQDDLPLAAARAVVKGRLAIGISTHGLAQARVAIAGGADYLGFGPIFPTATKENPDPVVGIAGLAAVVAEAGDVPVVAIGGISLDRIAEVAATGAAAAAVIGAVDGAADSLAAARAIVAAFGAPAGPRAPV